MTTHKTVFVASLVMIASACATAPPVPVTVDTSVPAMVETEGLRAALRVPSRVETERLFGGDVGAHFEVVELKVENRGALSVSVERKRIRIVTPEAQEVYPVSPLGIANRMRGQAMISSGSNVLDAVQLIFGLARLAENYDIAAKWEHLIPETFKVAAGEERRMLLAFTMSHRAPGLWRFELPFSSGPGAAGPQLSIPLMFKVAARPSG